MAAAWGAVGATSSQSSGTSLAMNLPSGIVAGHVLVLQFETVGTSITTPTGWTLRAGVTSLTGGPGGCAAVFTRTATGSDAVTVAHGSGEATGFVHRLTGVIEAPDQVGTPSTLTNGQVLATPTTAATSVNGCLIFRTAMGGGATTTRNWSWATSTLRCGGSGASAKCSVSGATAIQASAGAAGTENATADLAATWAVGFTLAFAPSSTNTNISVTTALSLGASMSKSRGTSQAKTTALSLTATAAQSVARFRSATTALSLTATGTKALALSRAFTTGLSLTATASKSIGRLRSFTTALSLTASGRIDMGLDVLNRIRGAVKRLFIFDD